MRQSDPSSKYRFFNHLRRAPGILIFGVALVVGLIFQSGDGAASVPVSGTLKAEHACQAFISKNKKTNPNFQLLHIDTTYPLLEANRPDQPDWYRVRITGAEPEQRWVPAFCGRITLNKDDSGNNSGGGNGGNGGHIGGDLPSGSCSKTNCNTADTEESFLLAVSWQPAFCKSHGSKPECKIKDPDSYQATHLTLHGLWPNKLSRCGKNYGFCGSLCKKPRQRGMCNYPEVPLSATVRQDLSEVMPSVSAGSCLERHEWWKHGTCSGWSADDYYTVSARLVREFNNGGVSGLLAKNLGKRVSERELFQVVDDHFGPGTHKTLKLSCSGSGELTEIQITLPKDIGKNTPLPELFQQAVPTASGPRSNCPGQFKIIPITTRHGIGR